MVCIRCQKRPAIIFVQRMENGQMKNEGYCLHCAREMHIKPVDDLMKQFGMSDEDMDAMEDRMENMMQEMGDMSNMNPFSMMMGHRPAGPERGGRRPCARLQRHLPAGGERRCPERQKQKEDGQK